MNQKDTLIAIRRIEQVYHRATAAIVKEAVALEAAFAVSSEPVKFIERTKLSYIPIKTGEIWGRTWESAWFRLVGTVPADWSGKTVVAQLDLGGEGLVYLPDGKALQGITNGSVFDTEFGRDIVRLHDSCSGGEPVELWVDATASGLFGMFCDLDPGPKATNRYGCYDARVNVIRLGLFDTDMWHLTLDLRVLLGLIKSLPEKSVRRARIIRTAMTGLNEYAKSGNIPCVYREILAPELTKQASASSLSITAVGHAHIDTAWLWPVSETIRKCARTFATQLALMERYPGYVFGASQPQHYDFVKNSYPELYLRIKQAAADGKWELQGGMWVEADCNVTGGESLVRQLLHGKNYFKDEFGVDVDNLWLPDVFGYSAALPQILRKSGIAYFLTQKLSWNQINEFPYHTFIWQGIDGSEVLAHFPPENTYNSQLAPESLVAAQNQFKENDYIDEFISLFGVG
ncbi:MAG: alpha-mannosidase 2c1, partial [candidate division Zixibacteria bacterium]|nr:alpha-mannosidase 2c1 [candidate division Zixibacteria bacterium]